MDNQLLKKREEVDYINTENPYFDFKHPQTISNKGRPGEVSFHIVIRTEQEWNNWSPEGYARPSVISRQNNLVFTYVRECSCPR